MVTLAAAGRADDCVLFAAASTCACDASSHLTSLHENRRNWHTSTAALVLYGQRMSSTLWRFALWWLACLALSNVWCVCSAVLAVRKRLWTLDGHRGLMLPSGVKTLKISKAAHVTSIKRLSCAAAAHPADPTHSAEHKMLGSFVV